MPEKLLSAKKCFKAHTSEVTRLAVSHIAESQKSYWRRKEAGARRGRDTLVSRSVQHAHDKLRARVWILSEREVDAIRQ